jgi:hypothetical protein
MFSREEPEERGNMGGRGGDERNKRGGQRGSNSVVKTFTLQLELLDGSRKVYLKCPAMFIHSIRLERGKMSIQWLLILREVNERTHRSSVLHCLPMNSILFSLQVDTSLQCQHRRWRSTVLIKLWQRCCTFISYAIMKTAADEGRLHAIVNAFMVICNH